MRPAILTCLLATGGVLSAQGARPVQAAQGVTPAIKPHLKALTDALVAKYGEGQRGRIERGLQQAGRFWRPQDGDGKVFAAFVKEHFAGDPAALDTLFNRLSFVLESLYGHLGEIRRDLNWGADIAQGPLLPVDGLTSAYDPGAHLEEDCFANKLAFVVLLNFPISDLTQRLKEGEGWTRRQWAEARLAERFTTRVPADVRLAQAAAAADAGAYISGYNFWMHHLVDPEGQRLFPPKLRLLSHWNLRDEIKGQYAHGPEGLKRQQLIQALMTRIVLQEVPKVVIDNPLVDWSPAGPSKVKATAVQDSDKPLTPGTNVDPVTEQDTRYAKILANFKAVRREDAYSPATPTFFARRFDGERQIPEARVKAMLEAVCQSPLVPKVAQLIEARLGRKLEPFDLWFSGFKPGANLDERKLDELTRAKYPNAEAFQKDLPNIIQGIGFSAEKATWLAERIAVDPARGSGHAMGAEHRKAQARLRTRIAAEGMDYKGFNIAVHELGHNVEQTFSMYGVDHWLLNGVPNTAFTEAIAFTFQARDLRLLGQPEPDAQAKAMAVLHEFWQTLEISAVGLVDMAVWRWLYEHPDATPAQLKAAVVRFAQAQWQKTYGPVMRVQDSVLLGVYSHMVNTNLYLPDYPLGHLIAFQLDQHLKNMPRIGEEIERICRIGRVTPDAWMRQATGRPVGPEALLDATAEALKVVAQPRP